MRLRFFFSCIGVALALSGAASAQPNDGASARADQLTRVGNDLAKRGEWPQARAAFRDAWALKHAYDIGANLGFSELHTGAFRDAAEHLTYAARTFPASGKPEHLALLKRSLAEARAQVGAVTVVAAPTGAHVFVDGVDSGASPLEDQVFVDAGEHVVEVKLSGYAAAKRSVTAAKGSEQRVEVTLVAEAPSASHVVGPPPPPPPADARRPVRWPAAVAGGVALGGVALGIVGAVVASGKRSDGDNARSGLVAAGVDCTAPPPSSAAACSTLSSSASSHDTFTDVEVAGFVIAGVAGLATAGLLIWPPTVADRVQVGAAPTRDGARFNLRLNF
ncbi:MAG TPA: PEGA domain-containing protein [Byssovorax sp.]|jgi:hypothetical protein